VTVKSTATSYKMCKNLKVYNRNVLSVSNADGGKITAKNRQHEHTLRTSGQSNLITGHIDVAHGRFNSMCQVASVTSHLTHASLGPPEFKSQTASRSVQPFLHSLWQSISIL